MVPKWNLPQANFFSTNSSIKRIIYETKVFELAKRGQAFEPQLYEHLTSLEAIQIQDEYESALWPVTEYVIFADTCDRYSVDCRQPRREYGSGKNPWPSRAEHLARANIKLLDYHGKHWTPRLAITSKKRR